MIHSKVLKYCFLLLGLMAISASAQPTIIDSEIPTNIGLTNWQIGGGPYDFGSPVPGNAPWNFNSSPSTDTFSHTFINKASAPFSDSFPSATFAVRNDDPVYPTYTFASKSSSSILIYGYSDDSTATVFSNTQRYLEFPLSMGDAWQDTFAYTFMAIPITIYVNNRVTRWGNLTVPAFSNLPSLVLRSQYIFEFFGIQDTSWHYDWLVENWGTGAETSVDFNDTTTSIADNLDKLWMTQVGVEEGREIQLENSLRLSIQPNPMNSSTIFQFQLPSDGPVSLEIYDLTGRLVQTLVKGVGTRGVYTLPWEGKKNPVGLYFARLSLGEEILTKKIILLR